MNGLKGKAAIVTGGSRGIGKAITERLLSEGVNVLFCGRNKETGLATLAELSKKYGDRVRFTSCDMGNRETPEILIAEGRALFGELDFLVNNAFPFTAKAMDATYEDWTHVFMAGPAAYARMIAEFVKQRERREGAIVCVSSISGHIAQPLRWTYNAAKGAVKQLIRCAALDLAPAIRVNCVSPGWVWTDEVAKATPDGTRESVPKAWEEYHILQHLQEPSQIASTVAFLLSDDAAVITGHDLFADSGYLAMGPEGLGKTANFAGSN
ncbi:MAG: SDR family oxidoreductase [Dysgonamonadaceae bacterium]|jgi:NAD(P)-dependent dehydrogenase (short-subunit alcohol dehydrogenase family)|nr:SDR family oxidoreductase [Dysgonamonadaceae bacterium]